MEHSKLAPPSMLGSPSALWSVCKRVSVLYTGLAPKKMPIWKDGEVQIVSGKATLLSAAGQPLDGATVSQAMLSSFFSGSEVHFEGHRLHAIDVADSTLLQDAKSEAEPRSRAFKRPRVLHHPAEASTDTCTDGEACAAPTNRDTPRKHNNRQMNHSPQHGHTKISLDNLDLWHECVLADRDKRGSALDDDSTDLWESSVRVDLCMMKCIRRWTKLGKSC